MIKRLRKRFIRITTVSVAAVMLVLTLIVNVANFVSTDAGLKNTLAIIAENRGEMPNRLDWNGPADGEVPPAPPDGETPLGDGTPPSDAPSGPNGKNGGFDGKDRKRTDFGGQMNEEALYSTRYFTLTYDADGTLESANLDRIAAVTETDAGAYLAIARAKGEGYGFTGDYRYYVTKTADGGYMAVFLECFREFRSMRLLAILSLAAAAFCVLLVYLLVKLLSRKAIDPTVRAIEQQKQFITDASHELKTPLTVINTSLSVLEMETGQNKWIDKANAQTMKMSELIGALVTLSRLDEEDPRLTMADFNISDAVTEVAESFREPAGANGHSLEIAVEPGLSYRGSETSIRQLVSILLENALKYTTEGAPIRLSLEAAKRGVVLRESNACEPIDKADLGRLFDRFYRPDKSRTSSTGGFGVGLSIARAVCEAHNGSIRAACPQDGEIEFTAVLK